MSFVHLHLHSEYSLVDGLVNIKPLIAKSVEQGAPAVAVTDQHNLFAAVKLFSNATANKIKPILGADLRVHHPDGSGDSSRMVLLIMNNAGYLNLSFLLSRAYREGQYANVPMIELDWLEGRTEGLICLTGGPEGIFTDVLTKPPALQKGIQQFKRWFPDRLYLEVSRVGRPNEEMLINRTVQAAKQYQLPIVATNDVRFLNKDDFEAHEARVCINQGVQLGDSRRRKDYTPEQYLKSPEEMKALFKDLPSAIQNSVEIAKRCSHQMDLGNHYLPDFPVPEGQTIEEFLASESFKGLEERFPVLYPDPADQARHKQTYWDRLQVELDVINGMGFPGYFLIVADFIKWGKNNGVPVGPGRGSGAGSLVAYALKITDLDPLQYDLLFERFLNPERVSLPDFDVDFCMVGRDRVIDYVSRHYGKNHVSQIITFGTMAAKGVLRDTGRILGFPYGMVDGLSKLVPFELKMTLAKALEVEPRLKQRYDKEEDVKNIIDLAMKLEGTVRNVGKHAGGVVISPKALEHYTPVYCEENGSALVSQYDKDDVENAGLVKFDFLGLKTLTVIDYAIKNIKKSTGKDIDITTLPMNDKASFDLLKRAETTAVFQLESRGMKELIKKLQPDCFEDIIALVALFRPGPLNSGMVDDFVNRKHGRAEINYPHPDLEAVLKPTYGVIVYQEQVMQIAQILAGYTLGGADMLRRAMGKKKPEEMAKQRTIFVTGAKERGIDEAQSGPIFDLMEKFAEYGFNKSHSAAYALIAYQTAWLKAHYPAAFMAAVMSTDMDNTDKIVSLISECHEMGLSVLPPDVNDSEVMFTVVDEKTIRYGLGAIKGVGESALQSAVQVRKDGRFVDMFDFACRLEPRKVTSKVMAALIHAGSFDSLTPNRATALEHIDKALKAGKQHQKNLNSGQFDMFSEVGNQPQQMKRVRRDPRKLELANEKAVLGLYLSGHPIDEYKAELSYFIPKPILELEAPESKGYKRVEKDVITAGLIIDRRIIVTKRGQRMAILTLDDATARIDVRLFPDTMEEFEALLEKDQLVIVKGKISMDNFSGKPMVTAQNVMNMTMARNQFAKSVHIHPVKDKVIDESAIDALKSLLQPFANGTVKVLYHYHSTENKINLELGDDWRLSLTDGCVEAINRSPGIEKMVINY